MVIFIFIYYSRSFLLLSVLLNFLFRIAVFRFRTFYTFNMKEINFGLSKLFCLKFPKSNAIFKVSHFYEPFSTIWRESAVLENTSHWCVLDMMRLCCSASLSLSSFFGNYCLFFLFFFFIQIHNALEILRQPPITNHN